MSVQQVAAPYRRLSLPSTAAVVAVAFILGALAGVGLPRAIGGVGRADTAAAPIAAAPATASRALPGVAVNNMSDAASQALAAARTLPGVAVNNMSDAASQALAAARTLPGVAVNNMSDAVAQALKPKTLPAVTASGAKRASSALTPVPAPGVAVNNMTDAVYRALNGTK